MTQIVILHPWCLGSGPYSPLNNVYAFRKFTDCAIKEPSDETQLSGLKVGLDATQHAKINFELASGLTSNEMAKGAYRCASATVTASPTTIFSDRRLNLSRCATASPICFCVARFNSSFSLPEVETQQNRKCQCQHLFVVAELCLRSHPEGNTHTGKFPKQSSGSS